MYFELMSTINLSLLFRCEFSELYFDIPASMNGRQNVKFSWNSVIRVCFDIFVELTYYFCHEFLCFIYNDVSRDVWKQEKKYRDFPNLLSLKD